MFRISNAPVEELNTSDFGEETIFTPTYSKLSVKYFKKLIQKEKKRTAEYAKPMKEMKHNYLSRSYFIFENQSDPSMKNKTNKGKIYQDRLEDNESLIYYHSFFEDDGIESDDEAFAPNKKRKKKRKKQKLNPKDLHERLVGQIQAFLMETKKKEPFEDEIEVISFEKSNFGLAFYNNKEFVVVVGFDKNVPHKIITTHMKRIKLGISLFNGNMDKEKDDYLHLLKIVGNEISDHIEPIGYNYLLGFDFLPYYKLPFEKNSAFIYCSQYLRNFENIFDYDEENEDSETEDNGYIAGAILYDNKIIINSIRNDLIYWLIYKSKHLSTFTSNYDSIKYWETKENDGNNEKLFEEIAEKSIFCDIIKNSSVVKDQLHQLEEEKNLILNNFPNENIDFDLKYSTIFNSNIKRHHTRISYRDDDIQDFALIYVEKEVLEELRRENYVEKPKNEELQKKFDKFNIKNDENGEFIFCFIHKVEGVTAITLWELTALIPSNFDEIVYEDDLIELEDRLSKIIGSREEEQDMLFLRRQSSSSSLSQNSNPNLSMKRPINTKKDILYDNLTKKLVFAQGNEMDPWTESYPFLEKFSLCHQSFNFSNTRKVVIKNPNEYIFCKKIFNNEIFYQRNKEKDEKTNLNGFEKEVRTNFVRKYKIEI